MTTGNTTVRDIKEEVSHRTADDMEHLRDSFQQLRSDVMDLLGAAFGAGKHGADAVKDRAAGAVDDLKHRLSDLKGRGADAMGTVEKRIEDHPMQSALVAFGVGFILAKLLTRR